jgi:hypothetical protein
MILRWTWFLTAPALYAIGGGAHDRRLRLDPAAARKGRCHPRRRLPLRLAARTPRAGTPGPAVLLGEPAGEWVFPTDRADRAEQARQLLSRRAVPGRARLAEAADR